MGWNFFTSSGEIKKLYKSASTVSETAPLNPTNGDIWTNSNNMVTYIYYSDGTSSQWVEVANNARPTTMYGTFANRPAASTTGLYYFATDTSRLYLDTGTAWQEVVGPSTPAGGDLSGTYPNPTIANDAVTAAKIATDAVDSAEIKAGAVGASELAAGVGWVKLGTFTDNTTTLDYTSIPSTYTHLQARIIGQSARSGFANTGGRLIINSVSANYSGTYIYGGITATAYAGETTWYVGQIPAGSRTADERVALITVDIPFYARTNSLKGMTSTNVMSDGSSNVHYWTSGFNANSGASGAITSITFRDEVSGNLGPRRYAELWAC